jgi:hypothetical protein
LARDWELCYRLTALVVEGRAYIPSALARVGDQSGDLNSDGKRLNGPWMRLHSWTETAEKTLRVEHADFADRLLATGVYEGEPWVPELLATFEARAELLESWARPGSELFPNLRAS